ncbi:MAG: hypothetical protein A2W18_13300 [Candidatus Muproteobacteria bacterium RBG_16_60_9]|uniref:Uncharacterized protein n=1 Tax=Candidatus Muproteobacteria bacterium RBG_16_60_9 TaxID=1817755 RepID=A0A1F6VA86_9PROT|nr:MAG: hypothetical protein A2W18_13300 [Candidatus Muproteobacteria bacterium RBG_16_60_9]
MRELSTAPDKLAGPDAPNETAIVALPVLPASSFAVTTMTLVPFTKPTPATFQFDVPLASPLAPVALLRQETLLTFTLSDAIPPNASDAEFAG